MKITGLPKNLHGFDELSCDLCAYRQQRLRGRGE